MSYTKQNFVSGQVISAAHLNHMEDGIAEAQQMAEDKTSGLSAEIVRIKQAVQSNTNAITAEKTRATGEEARLDKALTAEVDRAQKAEKELSDRIDDLPTGGSADLTIGTVTSGETAGANITNGKLNLVLPKGDKGDKGDTGAQGPQGPKGDTGASGDGSGGLSDEEKSLLLSMLARAAYNCEGMQSIYSKLSSLWDVELVEPVVVPVAVQSVTLNRTTLNLRAGRTVTLTAEVLPRKASDKTVTWTVSPEGYATVKNGVVTTLKTGRCTVTATAGEVSAICTVNVIAEPSSTSVPGETPVYKLDAARTFVAADKEYIDTGLKPFATIDPKPDWTILLEVQGGANVGNDQELLHSITEIEPWPGITIGIASGKGLRAAVYGGTVILASSLNTLKKEKMRLAVRVTGTTLTGWTSETGPVTAAITRYDTVVDKNLLLGCYQETDGTKGRFFDGTVYQCMIFHKALSDAQVTTWLTT